MKDDVELVNINKKDAGLDTQTLLRLLYDEGKNLIFNPRRKVQFLFGPCRWLGRRGSARRLSRKNVAGNTLTEDARGKTGKSSEL